MTTEQQAAFTDWSKALVAEKKASSDSIAASLLSNEAMERHVQAKEYANRCFDRLIKLARAGVPASEAVTVESAPVPAVAGKIIPPQGGSGTAKPSKR